MHLLSPFMSIPLELRTYMQHFAMSRAPPAQKRETLPGSHAGMYLSAGIIFTKYLRGARAFRTAFATFSEITMHGSFPDSGANPYAMPMMIPPTSLEALSTQGRTKS